MELGDILPSPSIGAALSKYTQITINLIAICIGGGIVGSVLGVLWYKVVAPSALTKETILFIVKVFMGIALAGVIVTILTRYIM